jgi:hypothetical protein
MELKQIFKQQASKMAKHYQVKKYLTKRFVKAYGRKQKVNTLSQIKAEVRHYFTLAFVKIFQKNEQKYR